ncbi:hypothetical protein TNCV_4736851 [Trichonephila clavipes]|nr:hypothetical protein TNCV_4736851 [Trichonephila clavipes]
MFKISRKSATEKEGVGRQSTLTTDNNVSQAKGLVTTDSSNEFFFQTMELLRLTFAVMCFLSNLNTSTYVASEEGKEGSAALDTGVVLSRSFIMNHDSMCSIMMGEFLSRDTIESTSDVLAFNIVPRDLQQVHERQGCHRFPEKGKCPAVPEGIEHNCISIEARCCSTHECEEREGMRGMICCRRLCRFRCMKEDDPERVGNEPDINLTPEECRNLTGRN